MKGVKLYAQVRYAVQIDGLSRREAARRFGIDPRTVSKMLAFSVPPGYRRSRPAARPKLDPFIGIIDRILVEDEGRPRKQRHTSKRIFERLRDEHGYSGGITIVKDYVLSRRLRHREVFVPLRHDPGHAQVDFGEALAEIAGVESKIHFFAMDLPHSDACFAQAYVDEVVISCGAEVIARHAGSYEREDFVFDPLHYLALLEHKVGALDQAAPLVGWDLPEEFATLRRLIEARMAKRGKREFVQILRLLEVFRPEDVLAGVKEAIARGAIGFDAVKHLVLCRIERRPPRLDLTVYPYL